MRNSGFVLQNLIRALLVLPAAAAAVPALAAEKPPPPLVAGAEHTTLYDQRYVLGFKFYRLEDGSWYVRFESQETSSHMDPRKRPHAVVSKDGRTWRETDLLADNPQFRSSPTRLVNVTNYSYRYDDPSRRAFYEAEGLEVRDTPDGQIAYSKGAYVAISNDNGVTWIQRDLDMPGRALLAAYRDDRAYLRLDSRTILRAFYGKPVARLRYYEAWFARSEDDGETWTTGTIAADVEQDASHGETAIALAGDNDIVAMMRSEPAPGSSMWVCRSSDRGKTWSKAVETPLHGHPAHLLLLQDGRLLCSYGMRDQPVGIRVCISDDHGRTWRAEDVRVLRTGADFNRDSGYPITRQADDGTLLTVYYLTRGEKTSVELTRWRLPKK
jgi:hypothetical protein